MLQAGGVPPDDGILGSIVGYFCLPMNLQPVVPVVLVDVPGLLLLGVTLVPLLHPFVDLQHPQVSSVVVLPLRIQMQARFERCLRKKQALQYRRHG